MKRAYIALIGAAVLNAASWLWVALKVPREAFPIIVQYHIFSGGDVLGEWPMIFTAPLLGAAILAVNALLIRGLRQPEHQFLRLMLSGAALVLNAFILLIAWIVVRTNT